MFDVTSRVYLLKFKNKIKFKKKKKRVYLQEYA